RLHHLSGAAWSPAREARRGLADGGTVLALDRRPALADARGDLDELGELLDEGCLHAGRLLTRRAVAAGDLRALQGIADAGYDQAGDELNRLLARPSDEERGAAQRPPFSGRHRSDQKPP